MPTQTFLQLLHQGRPLDELDGQLGEIDVDLRMGMPSTLTATWRASSNEVKPTVGDELEAQVWNETGKKATLLTATITSTHVGYSGRGTTVTVVAQDPLYAASRGRHSGEWVNATISDVVGQVLRGLGVPADVKSAATVHETILQWDETDLEFILRLGDEIGYGLWTAEGKVTFAPAVVKPAQAIKVEPDEVFRLDLSQDIAQMVKQVNVHYWDAQKKEGMVATANVTKPTPVDSAFASAKDNVFGWPVQTNAAATDKVKALSDVIASARMTMQATLDGDGKYIVGSTVNFKNALDSAEDTELAKDYFVSRARHRWEPERGYTVDVDSAPHRDLSLHGLGGGRRARQDTKGVVSGVVTSLKDPEKQGRVKVQLPWTDPLLTAWARVSMMGAGEKRGLNIVPEVNDEVFVAFQHGDLRRPVILGGAYNGKDKSSSETVENEEVTARTWYSRTGHHFILDDEPRQGGITVSTGDNANKIHLIEKDGSIEITADKGGITLTSSSGDVTLKGKNITLNTPGELKLDGNNVKVNAKANCAVQANANVTIAGNSKVEVASKGQLKLSGMAAAELTAAGITQVKGALVKIN